MNLKVVCRRCDIIMEHEGTAPDGYDLFKCPLCGNMIALKVRQDD